MAGWTCPDREIAEWDGTIQATNKIKAPLLSGVLENPVSQVAGNNTEVQFNNNGAFGASSSFTWDGSKLTSTYYNATDEDNIIQLNGTRILWIDTTTNALALGENAVNNGGVSGSYNLGIGKNSLSKVGAGIANTAIGYNSLPNTTSGNYNTALGYATLVSNQTGYGNFAMGFNAANHTTGNLNFALGYNSLADNTTGTGNIAIGSQSLTDLDDFYNVAIGTYSMYKATSARGNTTIGHQVGNELTTGDYNVFIGYQAGYRQTTNSNLLIIDNRDRTTAVNEVSNALIYGSFNASPSSQFLNINGNLFLTQVKTGSTQANAGANAGEVWATASHATLPDNVLMIGV